MTGFPLVLYDDVAGASHTIGNMQSSNQPREDKNDDLDAADMPTFSVENSVTVYNSK